MLDEITGYKIIIDRKEAINYAINNACQKDIVLVLGKGNENYIGGRGVREP